MIAIYFLYGLAFFCLGLVVALQTRQSSELPLIHQLPWLAAFGFSHSLVEWSDMFLLADPAASVREALIATRLVMLILSALMLIRLGVGLIRDGGPLPGQCL